MKAFILASTLLTALTVCAQSVFVHPTIINFGNQAQVQIHNTTQDDINCSGTVYMHTSTGRMETGYYFDYIMKGRLSMRSFYLMNFNDRISFTNHSIFCNKR
jgi:hypothetical protein